LGALAPIPIGVRIEESWLRLGRIDGWRNDLFVRAAESWFTARVSELRSSTTLRSKRCWKALRRRFVSPSLLSRGTQVRFRICCPGHPSTDLPPGSAHGIIRHQNLL